MQPDPTQTDFSSLGIAPKLLDILNRLKITSPTPIQSQSIPKAIEGNDLIGIAQTGTGKTFAYGLPMIQKLCQSTQSEKGLIVVPTRELAIQVNESLKRIGASMGLKTCVLIGGEDTRKQLRILKTNPHIVIGTPGRLMDHLDHKTISFGKVGVVVLDEADRMLDMGFAPQVQKVMSHVPEKKQMMLFSATMPSAIVDLAKQYMTMPLRIEVAPQGTPASTLSQEVFVVSRQDKPTLLKKVLGEYRDSVLVFTRTKFGAKNIAKLIKDFGYTTAELHSNKSLNQRMEALNGFRTGKYRVLVATDIAARGIDVTGVQLVINFDLPDNPEDYVHRIGRTGRAGRTGHAISFAMPDQRRDVRDIERLIKKPIPFTKHQNSTDPNAEKVLMPFDDSEPLPKRGGRFSGGTPGARNPHRNPRSSGRQNRGFRR